VDCIRRCSASSSRRRRRGPLAEGAAEDRRRGEDRQGPTPGPQRQV